MAGGNQAKEAETQLEPTGQDECRGEARVAVCSGSKGEKRFPGAKWDANLVSVVRTGLQLRSQSSRRVED